MPPKHDGAVVTAALRAARGNLSAAARSLGHDPKTLWRRVQRNPALWPDGVPRLLAGGMPGAMRRQSACPPIKSRAALYPSQRSSSTSSTPSRLRTMDSDRG